MNGASQDAEGLPPQSELRGVGPQPLQTVHCPHLNMRSYGTKSEIAGLISEEQT